MRKRAEAPETKEESKPRDQMTEAEKLEAWRKKRDTQGTFEKPGGKKRTKDL